MWNSISSIYVKPVLLKCAVDTLDVKIYIGQKDTGMFILADTIDYGRGYKNQDDFAEVYEKLRREGCHSPTRGSLLRVFKAIKTLCMLAKLSDEEVWRSRNLLSMEALLKQLNGPEGRLDLTGRGFEFSGWYTEIFAFEVAGLITGPSHSFRVTEKFFKRFCDNRPEEEIHDHLIEFIHYYGDKIHAEIVNRAKRFDLVHLLVAAVFTERTNITEDRLNHDNWLVIRQ
ncbi:hypothetical protein D3C87_835270 [compost metagenome]